MDLKKIIVHELKKDAGKEETSLLASDNLLPIDQESIELVNSLLNSYKNDNLLNAQFDKTPGKYFPERLDTYRATNRTESEFKKFTIEAIGNLVTIIKRKIAAKGGYIVFCEYETNNGINFLSIFLIRDVEGKILKRSGNSFSIGRIEYLDTNHLAMACRINENLLNTEQNYLTFTRLRQQDVSDYFIDWICALQPKSSAEFTDALYDIINGLELPLNETGQQFSIDEIRDMVYETARNNPRREVNISTISEQIYGDSQRIRNYAEEHQISIDTEFRYDKRRLKRFVQLNIRKDGIDIKFSRGDLGTKVWPSEENPNLVIIESEALAAALRAEQ